MNIDKLTDKILLQMGWSDVDSGVRNTVRVAIKATVAAVENDSGDADKADVASIIEAYEND